VRWVLLGDDFQGRFPGKYTPQVNDVLAAFEGKNGLEFTDGFVEYVGGSCDMSMKFWGILTKRESVGGR